MLPFENARAWSWASWRSPWLRRLRLTFVAIVSGLAALHLTEWPHAKA